VDAGRKGYRDDRRHLRATGRRPSTGANAIVNDQDLREAAAKPAGVQFGDTLADRAGQAGRK